LFTQPKSKAQKAQAADVAARQEKAKTEEEALKKTRERSGRPVLGFINDLLPGARTLGGA
jgi:hypothetical protein